MARSRDGQLVAELAFKVCGVEIYHVYKYGFCHGRKLDMHYTTAKDDTNYDRYSFDIRDHGYVENYKEAGWYTQLESGAVSAIASGLKSGNIELLPVQARRYKKYLKMLKFQEDSEIDRVLMPIVLFTDNCETKERKMVCASTFLQLHRETKGCTAVWCFDRTQWSGIKKRYIVHDENGAAIGLIKIDYQNGGTLHYSPDEGKTWYTEIAYAIAHIYRTDNLGNLIAQPIAI